jgi:FKBP-type peptidyl-prolyl cis-trans isomerase
MGVYFMRNKLPLFIIAGTVLTIIAFIIIISVSGSQKESANANKSNSSLMQSSQNSNLKIEILEEGTGATTKNGQKITVHYTGTFLDGKKFDSSLDRNQPFTFNLGAGQVIKGWDQGFVNQKIGSKIKLTVPPQLGYGMNDYGPIKGGSTLVFDVEILGAE